MSLSMFVLLPLFVRAVGGTDVTVGLLLGGGAAASVAVRPAVGVLLDRFGRRRMLLWGNGLNAVSFLPFLLIQTLGPALVAASVAHTVIWGVLFASYFTYASDLTPPVRRAEGIAMFGVFGILTNGLGPALGEALIERAGFPTFFVVATGFAATSLLLTLLVPPAPAVRHHAPAGAHLRELVREGGAGLVRTFAAMACFGAGVNAAFSFVALFTRDVAIARAAPFFLAYSGTSVVLRLFGRRLPDRVGPHRVAVPAFGVFAAGLASLCLLPAPGLLVLAGIACGAGHGSLWPVLQALTLLRTPARLQGTAVSLATAALDLGAVLGTPICGAVAEAAGYRAMFVLMAGLALAGMLLMATDPDGRRGLA